MSGMSGRQKIMARGVNQALRSLIAGIEHCQASTREGKWLWSMEAATQRIQAADYRAFLSLTSRNHQYMSAVLTEMNRALLHHRRWTDYKLALLSMKPTSFTPSQEMHGQLQFASLWLMPSGSWPVRPPVSLKICMEHRNSWARILVLLLATSVRTNSLCGVFGRHR